MMGITEKITLRKIREELIELDPVSQVAMQRAEKVAIVPFDDGYGLRAEAGGRICYIHTAETEHDFEGPICFDSVSDAYDFICSYENSTGRSVEVAILPRTRKGSPK